MPVTFDIAPLMANKRIWNHLKKSDLSDDTIARADIVVATEDMVPANAEILAAYTFWLHDPTNGKRSSWRTRLIREHEPHGIQRYHQVGGNRIYLPPTIDPEVWLDPTYDLILVEGEKKALRAWQAGFNAFALTGVSSWHRRSFELSGKAVKRDGKNYVYVVPRNEEQPKFLIGVADWLDYIHYAGRKVTVIFDTDPRFNKNVQQEAFNIALWMDKRGAQVRQVFLPVPKGMEGEKIGLDDWCAVYGDNAGYELQRLIDDRKFMFPYYPDIRQWLVGQLELVNRVNKENYKTISRAIIADLDHHGRRYVDTEANKFYYLLHDPDHRNKLFEFELTSAALRDIRGSAFGKLLMTRYFVHSIEGDLLSMIADDFSTVEPITEVHPRRLCWCNGDNIYIQIDDTRHIRVNAEGWQVLDNGTEMMFHSGVIKEPLDLELLRNYLAEFKSGVRKMTRLENMVSTLNLRGMGPLERGETALLLTALLRAVPWLRGWRNTQMPVIQILGESTSGKTNMANLIRWIMIASGSLDHITDDFRNFKTRTIHAPGMLLADNANKIDPKVRGLINDEVARLITEPDPHFSERQMHTNARELYFQVDCVFAFTAITTPFTSNDVIERSVTVRLNKLIGGGNQNWLSDHQTDRELWMAEIIYGLHLFMQFATGEEWVDKGFKSKHRLTNFEQIIYFMLRVGGLKAERAKELSEVLYQSVQDEIRSMDVALDAFQEWADEWYRTNGERGATIGQIKTWIDRHLGEYGDVAAFQTTRSLGTYISNNIGSLEQTCGIIMEFHRNAKTLKVLNPTERGRARE